MLLFPSISVFDSQTAWHIIKLFSPLGSHTILVFLYRTLLQYSERDPLMWRRMEGYITKMRKSRFSTNISLYLGNDTR